jgi:hypothetical protein
MAPFFMQIYYFNFSLPAHLETKYWLQLKQCENIPIDIIGLATG